MRTKTKKSKKILCKIANVYKAFLSGKGGLIKKEKEEKNKIKDVNESKRLKFNINFMNSLSLKKQLILSFALLVSVPVIVISIYTYISTRSTLMDKVKELNSQTTKQMTVNFENFLSKIPNTTFFTITQYDVSNYVPSNENGNDVTASTVISHLESARKNNGLNDYFILYDDGNFLGFPQSSSMLQADKLKLYKELEPLVGKNGAWITGYKDNYDLMYFVRKVNQKGILVTSIYTDKLTASFNSIINANIQEVDIINDKNIIVYSTNVKEIGQPIHESISDKINNPEGSFIHEKELVTFNSSGSFKLINTVSGDYIFTEINKMNFMNIVISLICVGIALVIGTVISSRIVKPIFEIVTHMKKVESGDFTVKSAYKSKNELGVLSTSFNVMVENIKLLVSNVMTVTNSIETKIENIKSIATDSSVASKQVSSAIEEIAAGSSEQAIQAEDTINTINKLAMSINDVTGSVDSVSKTTENTKQIGSKSLEKVKDLESKSIETDKTMKEITLTIDNLIKSINNIEGFLKLINDISNQTNLLSLNASIEAAHAGELGKGFAVVASEVKKLADQSKESTSEIAKVIKTIQNQTKLATELLRSSTKIFEEQKTAVEYTSVSFKEILVATDRITNEVGNVIGLVGGMNGLKENSIQAIKAISSVAEEASATTQEVTASTEEQTALSEELENLTNELFSEAQILKDSIGKFKINN